MSNHRARKSETQDPSQPIDASSRDSDVHLFESSGKVAPVAVVGTRESELFVQRAAPERATIVAAGVIVLRLAGSDGPAEQRND